jgi:hypothetical protein
MTTPVTLNTAPICYATNDGRKLKLDGTLQAEMTLSIAASQDPEEAEGFPWAIIAAGYEFSDNEGNRWRITSRFRSDLFVRTMMDFSSREGISVWKRLSKDFQRKFDEYIALRDIWFSDDDRFIRPLIVGSKIKQVQFKYFGVKFDIAVIPQAIDEDLHSPDVFVRTSPMLSYEAETIPSLCFGVDWKYLLVNTYSADLKPSDIPVPFIAESVIGTGRPQPSVVVVRD